jgi:hypothetical protein
MSAHVAAVEVWRLDLLVAYLGIALDEVLGICYYSLRAPNWIDVLLSSGEWNQSQRP